MASGQHSFGGFLTIYHTYSFDGWLKPFVTSRRDLWPFWVWLSDYNHSDMETPPPLAEKGIVCLLLVLMMILHIAFSQAGLSGSLLSLWEWTNFGRERERTQRQMEQDLRYETELFKTRMQNFSKVNKALTHSLFCLSLASFWRLLRTPSVVLLMQWLALLAGYAIHRFAESRIKTHFQFRCLECVGLSVHFLCTLSAFWETDLVLFFLSDKMLGVFLGFASLLFIDLQVIFSVYVVEAILLTYRCWQLIGFHKLFDNPVLIFASVISHILCAATIALVDINSRSIIRATQTSGDAFQRMGGFREVLRGVCDGDVLLDSNCTIVENANCLERLLRSNRCLSETNFLDLFLDAGSRDGFLHFMMLEDEKLEKPAIPRGLRVSLQGACGPVSLDLFHTRLPNQGDGNGYCLLAMKEDPEQKAPPEAPLQSVPSVKSTLQPTHSRSSDTEVVEALDELNEIALLISNASGCLDIVEAHLAFHRKSFAPTLESGMPTLRKFIRPSDWDRIERMMENINNLPPPETELERRCFFRHPMLFRVPGASRSYLRSKQTSFRLAGRVEDPGQPSYYWMHLSSFDDSHVLRPREQYLEEINEE